jgi:hypothetical protein
MVDRRRLWRAQNQDIHIKSKVSKNEFIVSGQSNDYRVDLCKPTCSCPDWNKRQPEGGCKHILLLKLDHDSIDPLPSANTSYDSAYGTDDDYPSNWSSLRNKTLRRDNWECQKCGVKGGVNESTTLHVHHIIPKSKGGKDKPHNLISLCRDCHEHQHGHRISTKRSEYSSNTDDNDSQEDQLKSLSVVRKQVDPYDSAFNGSPQRFWHFVAMADLHRPEFRGSNFHQQNRKNEFDRQSENVHKPSSAPTNKKETGKFSGLLIDIKEDGGLIKRCSKESCHLILQAGQCPEHGEINGVFDLHVKGVIDGRDSKQDVILDRKVISQMTGIDLVEAKQMARDALDTSVVLDRIRAKILGRRYQVSGPIIDRWLIINKFTQINEVVFSGTVVQAGSPVILDNGSETRQIETDAEVHLGEEVTVRGIENDNVIDANEIR